ncbi:glycosyltransferase family 2 protein [Nonomuraea jiangxiensis]|uniref:Glycosyltransferase, GT2 family n=1 Tax=Nonomuraea jiangxiensis TaxID=633440 RepID=A0A1G9GF99_9ACTN|nr:glycosyltransferase [Nonomuraea jiangxiensis]SDK99354.1 Glycosyltransferase, GT2 family [Nonomuraea jiangxiensis]
MITVVIPTVGRPTLRATLAAVGSALPVIVVDDRPGAATGLTGLPAHVRVVRSGGRGPAAARNAGWRAADTPWVAFLDDDVIPAPGWAEAVWKDLVDLPADVAGSQGRIVVPPPAGRAPTDIERHTAGLASALWVTADMAYRRSVLESLGGFDERFPRAYREDADLALRAGRAGHRLVRGGRVTEHPVRADGFWASVRFQRGNADDALMRRLHGPRWRADIGGARGRLPSHALTTAAGLAAVTLALAAGSGRAGGGRGVKVAAGLAAGLWGVLTCEFAWRRIAPGPRTAAEVARMAVTSVVIPPVACAHRLRGEWRVRG